MGSYEICHESLRKLTDSSQIYIAEIYDAEAGEVKRMAIRDSGKTGFQEGEKDLFILQDNKGTTQCQLASADAYSVYWPTHSGSLVMLQADDSRISRCALAPQAMTLYKKYLEKQQTAQFCEDTEVEATEDTAFTEEDHLSLSMAITYHDRDHDNILSLGDQLTEGPLTFVVSDIKTDDTNTEVALTAGNDFTEQVLLHSLGHYTEYVSLSELEEQTGRVFQIH